ncbi:hypothetical protein [Ramlibacter algicola]|uniref:Tat pathway signal protein n=1 Tax=Ramlibacter algicola TaxID=2795217 RepID=A0A934Q640_9BURK|nr:hypothetical protein [Ramlibacter algicola]MBK0394872.1 hypothetical protein [Ramlibacter algicola]
MTASRCARRAFLLGAAATCTFAAVPALAVAQQAATPPTDAPSPAPAARDLPPFTVRDARALAASAIPLAKKAEDVDLDYSPASLVAIDNIVLDMRDEGASPAAAAQVLLVLGCYVGEVLVRNTDGLWDEPTAAELQAGARVPGIRGKSGRFYDPVGQVFRLLQEGGGESLAFYFARVKRDAAQS